MCKEKTFSFTHQGQSINKSVILFTQVGRRDRENVGVGGGEYPAQRTRREGSLSILTV